MHYQKLLNFGYYEVDDKIKKFNHKIFLLTKINNKLIIN